MATEVSIFDKPSKLPDELKQAARERGFPQDILDRAEELKVNRGIVDWWVNHERETPDEARKYLAAREKLMFGTMHARLATWNDDEAIADLYANAPEDIGEWEVTVERSPYPSRNFAFRNTSRSPSSKTGA